MDPTLERKRSLKNPSERLGEVRVSQLTFPTNSNSFAISYELCSSEQGCRIHTTSTLLC